MLHQVAGKADEEILVLYAGAIHFDSLPIYIVVERWTFGQLQKLLAAHRDTARQGSDAYAITLCMIPHPKLV